MIIFLFDTGFSALITPNNYCFVSQQGYSAVLSSGGLCQLEEMQPPPRAVPPGACGTPPPPTSGGSNAFRRNRPHKHGALAPNATSTPPPQPLTDPFAFGRQGSSSATVSNQTPLNSSPLPMQAPLGAGFNQTGPPQGPPSGAQVPIAGPVHTFFTHHAGPSGSPLGSNLSSAEPGYFSSQDPMPYIAQLTNSVPPIISSTVHASPAALTPSVQSTPSFQPTPPAPSHSGTDHGSRPPSVQNYFQPTSDTPQPFHAHPQAQAPPPAPLPHPGPFQSHTLNHSQSALPNMGEPAISQQQNALFSSQSYFSQTGGASEPLYSQVPQDPLQRTCPLLYTVPSADHGTLSMFFHGNDVENEETLSGEGHVNGVSHPPQGREANENINPCLNETGNVNVTTGPCDSVENLECVPNLEVLPNEPPSSHAYEAGPNLETPDTGSRPARSASVSSSYSNVSHSSGHTPHSSSHPPRRYQGVVGTFIQQESPRPPDTPASHPSAGGYFEQIDSAPAPEQSPTFPTPSPPKPVGVFQASANSSFEPVRSHSVGVRPAEVDRARMVKEKGGVDILPGNLEQPPDNMETIYFPGGQDRRPSSRAQGLRRPCESPATTLWAQSDAASLGANILLAPAAPSLATTMASSSKPSTEIIQPPEDGPLDLQPLLTHTQPHSENLENPPDSAPQASLGYASLLVSTPPTESLNQPVLIATPSSNYTVISPQIPVPTTNQMSPKDSNVPVQSPSQAQVASQLPQCSHSANLPPPLFSQTPIGFHPPSNQSPLNQAREVQDASLPVQPAQSTILKAQSPGSQSLPSSNSQIPSSVTVISQNHRSNYELLDFSMHQTQSTNQAPSHTAPTPGQVNNAAGFYLQVTKDSQQGTRVDNEPPLQQPTPNPPRVPSNQSSTAPSNPSNPANPASQYQPPPQATPVSQATTFSTYPPQSGNSAGTHDPQRPPSVHGGQQGYSVPPPVPPEPGLGSYYAEYQDGRHSFPQPYPHMDPRAQSYYQVLLSFLYFHDL